ncbi:hypothetical protein V8F63_08375 [Brevundimonas sp. LF-1]|uniref:hypothetical protein n=1 Tax=Brevundimonas sp. LF-1 TaxID=3126100 RepID=UPI0030E35BF1
MTNSADRYLSTRGDAAPTRFSDALLRGIAPDGGLYMPQAWPALPVDATRPGRSYAEIAKAAMAPFIGGALPAGALDRALDRLTQGFDHPLVTPSSSWSPACSCWSCSTARRRRSRIWPCSWSPPCRTRPCPRRARP